jgi:putative SOS response-associated peptidase YedK
MCGRYSLVPTENIATRFDVHQEPLTLLPRSNIAPSQVMPVIIREDTQRMLSMQWGLIPAWAKELRMKFSTINARAEGLTSSPVFRGPFRRRRCLVPASGFFEWQPTPRGKQPYCFQLRGGELFAFAGLYDIWRDPQGVDHYSYSIITTTPNELVAPVHNRMPVILHRDGEGSWLDASAQPAQLQALLAPYSAEQMEAFPVSRIVNNPANDSDELLQPLRAA